MAAAFVKILENRTKITKLSTLPLFVRVTKWAWCSNSTCTGKVHLLPKWIWLPPFLPKWRGNGSHARFSTKASQHGCDPFAQDNQSLLQSPLCLPLSHRSFGLRYSLFSLPLKQTPLSQTCSQNYGWWITIHSWVINEAYCVHISSVTPIHSQDFPCK